MVEVLKDRRADNLEIVYLDDGTIKVTALVPWQEVVCDMYDQVWINFIGLHAPDLLRSKREARDMRISTTPKMTIVPLRYQK